MPATQTTAASATVTPLTPAIGAVIGGVDAGALDDAAFAALHAALMSHHVIFLRGQQLTNDRLVAFARRWGEPQPASESSFGKPDGFPKIDVLDYDATRPPYVTQEMWRTDLFDHLRTPEFQIRHHWQKGDRVVWDNRITLHYAVADYGERRLMHRITLQGDKPF